MTIAEELGMTGEIRIATLCTTAVRGCWPDQSGQPTGQRVEPSCPPGLLDALKAGLADADAKVLVVYGDARTFIAGADIKEFGKPPLPPALSASSTNSRPLLSLWWPRSTEQPWGLEVALGAGSGWRYRQPRSACRK